MNCERLSGMRFAELRRIALIALAAFVMAEPAVFAQNPTVDRTASNAVTRYLHKHRLPLVAAQVSVAAGGSRQVMLYGFVATDFGKQDAETKARRYLGEPHIAVVNHIRVDPSLRHLKKKTSPSQAGQNPNEPPTAEWERTVDKLLREGGAPPSNEQF
jgi:hypothetical protein